jgi:hypothetical protein
MKNIFFKQMTACLFLGIMLSCSKQKNAPGTASLTLINAVPGSTPSLVTNFSGTGPIVWYSNALKLTYGAATATNQVSAYSGNQPLAIYHYPDTGAHSTPLFDLDLELATGSIHTLFLTGTLSEPDTLFTTDTPPFHQTADSTLGIRFVNLMPGSDPVSVNIVGAANGSEVGSLDYKGITAFKIYKGTVGISNYNFEFRDATTGTLIGSLNVTNINAASNARRYRNFTLALMGLPGDPATKKLLLIESLLSI